MPDTPTPDKGPTMAACYIKAGYIIVDYKKPVNWVRMTSNEARAIGNELLSKADKNDGIEPDFSTMVRRTYDAAMHATADKLTEADTFVAMISSVVDDPLMLMQIGMAVTMDKPIRLVVAKGVPLPPALSKMAEMIEIVDWDKPDEIEAAMKKVSK